MNLSRPKDYADDPPSGTLFGGHFDESDDYRYRRPNGMDDWLIFYTIQGNGYLKTAEGEKRCDAGQLGFLRAGVPHEYGTVPGSRWNFYWVHFQKLPEIDYLPQEEAIVAAIPEGHMRSRVELAFENILSDSRERSSFWHLLCETSLREVILLAAQQLNQRLDPRIEHALQYLSRHMSDSIRIEDLAKAVGLSASRLSHLFKQETGESVVEHLNRLRLRQAALLMVHMGRNASEAALDVGFNNYNHFAALFRDMFGCSPRSYLKQGRTD
ncbi:helix-turn-helix domain-containing protein [Paenibacillus sp. N4]|uniref:helix-turn-helix domain-containing protein n=1 Tax=Paenibacillus vietnamensis TaxID=2590547 RepID=UPI001CD17037|nr:helix-turn-helix domain-containing protein [Paenibacillus vietnamensis]MCA0754787.1 helix-turn-helix domain-containing protein [Paenibacillus vietnamensis]